MDRNAADALWTYIGRDTYLLQIAPGRYLLRVEAHSLFANGGVNARVVVLDHGDDILAYLKVPRL